MFFIRKYAILISFFSIVLVFFLHRIPLNNLFVKAANEYQANLLENTAINCFVLIVILLVMMRLSIPLGLINMHYKLFPYYLPLISFVIIFSGGLSGVTNNAINFYNLDFTLFTIEALSSSFLEEFLFRGLITGLLLLKYWDSKKGMLKVVIYSSLLFGSTHLLNFWSQESMSLHSVGNQLFATTCLGFMMCAIYLKTRNIMVLVAAHFFINFIAGLSSVGETEVLQPSLHPSHFTSSTVIEEFFRLVLFGSPLLVGLLILGRVKREDVEKLGMET